jgi:amino acid transporter
MLIANTAGNIKDTEKNLPRAYYSSVIFAILFYIPVALVTVGNMSVAKIIDAKDTHLQKPPNLLWGASALH